MVKKKLYFSFGMNTKWNFTQPNGQDKKKKNGKVINAKVMGYFYYDRTVANSKS